MILPTVAEALAFLRPLWRWLRNEPSGPTYRYYTVRDTSGAGDFSQELVLRQDTTGIAFLVSNVELLALTIKIVGPNAPKLLDSVSLPANVRIPLNYPLAPLDRIKLSFGGTKANGADARLLVAVLPPPPAL